jgi:uncharacterized protein YndB with AHSA1/START domain
MAVKTDKKQDTSDRELVMTRVLDAPRNLVYEAWTNPKHIAQWWGPKGFTNTIHEMEVKVGGVWRFMMHGPDGTDYPNKVVFEEVVKAERLVYTHGSDQDDDPNSFHVTVTFEDQGKKTKLTMRMVLRSAAALAEAKKFGAVEGGNQTLDRLEAYLPTM